MILQLLSIGLLISLSIYWIVSARVAKKEKPLQKTPFSGYRFVIKYSFNFVEVLVILQLLGVPILLIEQQTALYQMIGFLIAVIGFSMCILARLALSHNWTQASDYQIKKDHKLITSGIYRLVRHPIYGGFALLFIGSEMVAGSWLWVSMLAFFIPAYIQARKEEKLLEAHFKKAYITYEEDTKMFIPYLF